MEHTTHYYLFINIRHFCDIVMTLTILFCFILCCRRLPVCHLSHPELFGQNGDSSVPRQNRPQLTPGAGRVHICQGIYHQQ